MEVRWVSLDGEEKKASTWSDLVELAMRNVSSHIQQAHPHLDGNRRDWVESSMVVTLGKLASAWRSGGVKCISGTALCRGVNTESIFTLSRIRANL